MVWALDVLDNDDSGEIDFKEFVEGMSKFSSKAEKEDKLRFAFRIYDIDNDGFISNKELFQVSLLFPHIPGILPMFLTDFTYHGGQEPEGISAAANCGQNYEVRRC